MRESQVKEAVFPKEIREIFKGLEKLEQDISNDIEMKIYKPINKINLNLENSKATNKNVEEISGMFLSALEIINKIKGRFDENQDKINLYLTLNETDEEFTYKIIFKFGDYFNILKRYYDLVHNLINYFETSSV